MQKRKSLVVGFDGFIDTIVKPVMQVSTAEKPAEFFATIGCFGEYIKKQAGKSCSIEFEPQMKKIGGNAPLFSLAASGLPLDTTCIGMLGEQDVDPLFAVMPCRLFTYSAPGHSTAIEFNDGKVFFAEGCSLGENPWQIFVQKAGSKALEHLQNADALALVNWSELSFSHSLWQGTLQNCVKQTPPNKNKLVFFDLSDCTRKPQTELLQVLQLMQEFSAFRRTILSLNENEALVLAKQVLEKETNLQNIATALRRKYALDEVIIHTLQQSILSCAQGVFEEPTLFVEKPLLSTGAGDNFNAASCFAALLGWPPQKRLTFANEFVQKYITTGKSPHWENAPTL